MSFELTYKPDNAAAKRLYARLGFVETGKYTLRARCTLSLCSSRHKRRSTASCGAAPL